MLMMHHHCIGENWRGSERHRHHHLLLLHDLETCEV
jgi:hypothetical protein